MPKERIDGGSGAPVFTDAGRVSFALYKSYGTDWDGGTTGAGKHSSSDNETLRACLQKALNARPAERLQQGGAGSNKFKYKINDGKGCIVFSIGEDGANSACIFHYHHNYNLDGPLTR